MHFEGARSAALIIAHPGHEILLHGVLESVRPVVFALTDGSGGAARSRTNFSRQLIEGAGARIGGVFGMASDRDWYRSILTGDISRFLEATALIETECVDQVVESIICDPIELFNPMHDLANALAHAVASRVARRCGRSIEVFTYPIEDARRFELRSPTAVALNAEQLSRKNQAITAYTPLAPECSRYTELVARDHELLALDNPTFDWPPALRETPYYERFGRARLMEGRYGSLITYADHVRPIALGLLTEERLAA